MQIDEASPRDPKQVVAPSLALDLAWVLHGATSPQLREQHEILEAVFGSNRKLADEVGEFWGDIDFPCFTELQVVSYVNGLLLETSTEKFFTHFENALRRPLPKMELVSERPQDRAAIFRRAAELSKSSKRRSDYLSLLQRVWAGVDLWWHEVGALRAEQTARVMSSAIKDGADWRMLIDNQCETLKEHMEEIIHLVDSKMKSIVIVPCALFGKGLYLDFPDAVLVGMATNAVDQSVRSRANDLARRFRALVDPTRLAILIRVSKESRTIGELAQIFDLSQPTVSNHVKALRESGLVNAERVGSRVNVRANSAAMTHLTDEFTAAISD